MQGRGKLFIELIISKIVLTAKRFKMNDLRANYERIWEILRKISTDRQLRVQRRCPKKVPLTIYMIVKNT